MSRSAAWDAADPFVTDADGHVVGLRCVPPHHAAMLADGWEGGRNLFPLVAASPEAFTADVLVYTRGSAMRALTLPDEPPYVYAVADAL